MSPLARVVAGPAPVVPPVRRLLLSLPELLLAARLAGDVPLPFTTAGGRDDPAATRMAARLAGTGQRARDVLTEARERAADPGPDGAAARLAARGLLGGRGPDPDLVVPLRALAEAPLRASVDVVRAGQDVEGRVRARWGVGRGALSGLVLRGGSGIELVSAAPGHWPAELARLVPAAPAVPAVADGDEAPPAVVRLPGEVLLGAVAARRRGRADLVGQLAAAHGTAPGARPLLHALGSRCRGRLRLLVVRRGADRPVAVSTWLLLDDGWRSLRPLGGGRVELRRRRPLDLGLASYPWVRRSA